MTTQSTPTIYVAVFEDGLKMVFVDKICLSHKNQVKSFLVSGISGDHLDSNGKKSPTQKPRSYKNPQGTAYLKGRLPADASSRALFLRRSQSEAGGQVISH